uniref:3-hydroxyisobutyryl-CoA hydrolase, mitochondrial n=1 Tax=Triatoma infestans TaxID=30076 RepID=A0A023FA16_TRIIF
MIAKRAEFSKIFNICGRFGIRRMTTTKPNVSDCEKEVLFECINNRGIITLNKPKALNAINYPMVCRILEKLQEWESDKDMVIIKGSGRAFCAGGDIVDITREGPSKAHKGKLFFKHEYLMNNFIGTYRKPYVALIDGITMGGGMGLSVHGKYRIATENTLCAMPETAIGLFPDVGGTHFLSRLPGAIGMFLALTGHRLKGADVCKAGIGTHFCSSKNMHELFDALVNKINPCNIQNEIDKYTEDISSVQFSLARQAVVIQRIFSLTTVEEIFCALEAEGTDFSLKTLDLLKKMSPTSLKLTVKGLHKGKHMSLQECLQMECRMAGHVMEACISSDFYEGVRALLIDKDKKPKWCPKLEDISDEMIETYFKPLQPDEELNI